jgi:hypothetical protein
VGLAFETLATDLVDEGTRFFFVTFVPTEAFRFLALPEEGETAKE